MENNISIRIYVKDGKVETVVPESPWEGQIGVQVIYHTDYPLSSDKLEPKVCKVEGCPEGPKLHRHDRFSTAVIRAESRK
jgi:hypothetical protein